MIWYVFAPLALVSAVALLRCGLLLAASWVYLWAIWLEATVQMVLNGGINSVAAVYYIALPISAAWLLGFRASLWSGCFCLGSSLILTFLEGNGEHMPRYAPGQPFEIWAGMLQAMLISVIPVARVLEISKEILARFVSDQQTLQEHQDRLEEIVRQRTAELVVARDQAQAGGQASHVLVTNMIYELRTPLHTMLGFSSLVRDDAGLSEDHRQDLDIVNRSGEHLLKLIDEMLDLAKIDAGRTVVEHTAFDLRNLVRDVMQVMRVRARAKGLDLRLEARSDLPRLVHSDAAKLRHVLVNLISNSVTYTEKGSVTVKVDADWVDGTRDLWLKIEIAGTGIGIAQGDLAHLFDPFVQRSSSVTPKSTGLVQSLTRQFVHLMGGRIQVQSAVGEGSSFRLELPLETAEEFTETAVREPRERIIRLAPGQPDFRILIVEHKEKDWRRLDRILQGAGFNVRVARDGERGIELFRTWRPQLICINLRLPGVGGLEAARRIRSLDGGRDTKIVALSTSLLTPHRAEVLAAGLDDFVRKPYRKGEVFDCMARLLSIRYDKSPLDATPEPMAVPGGALAALPESLRGELEKAIILLDVERIAQLVGDICKQDSALGEVLERHADIFAFTPILNALAASKGEAAVKQA